MSETPATPVPGVRYTPERVSTPDDVAFVDTRAYNDAGTNPTPREEEVVAARVARHNTEVVSKSPLPGPDTYQAPREQHEQEVPPYNPPDPRDSRRHPAHQAVGPDGLVPGRKGRVKMGDKDELRADETSSKPVNKR